MIRPANPSSTGAVSVPGARAGDFQGPERGLDNVAAPTVDDMPPGPADALAALLARYGRSPEWCKLAIERPSERETQTSAPGGHIQILG